MQQQLHEKDAQVGSGQHSAMVVDLVEIDNTPLEAA